jgi:hypothetical protein
MDEAFVESADFLLKYCEMISKEPIAERNKMKNEIRENRKIYMLKSYFSSK